MSLKKETEDTGKKANTKSKITDFSFWYPAAELLCNLGRWPSMQVYI